MATTVAEPEYYWLIELHTLFVVPVVFQKEQILRKTVGDWGRPESFRKLR